MKITALAPWFGGKRTMAQRIINAIGKHWGYWEPFCGSMAVLLSKPPCRSETVNDLHGDVTNLARVVASDEGPDLFDRLQRTAFCEGLHDEAKERLRAGGLSPFEQAYFYFIESWMGRNGAAGTRDNNTNFCVRYTGNGGDPATRFRSAVQSIPEWWKRLQGVWIIQRDAFELISRIDDVEGMAIYCDPPYLVKGSKYFHDFDNQQFLEFADGRVQPIGNCYETEPGEPAPNPISAHVYLAKLLKRFKHARVVVSYYDHPSLAEMYPADSWTKVSVDVTKGLVNQGMRDKGGVVKAPEVLLINQPPERGLF